MKLFCYFVEPASYTLDLVRNIHSKNQIDYCFIKSYSLAKSDKNSDKVFLDRMSFMTKLRFIISTYRYNDFIIINGYNNYVFVITFLLNFFSSKKRFIAIESDTQLIVPNDFLKRFVKWLYLSVIFRSKYVLGFAGGNDTHKNLFRNYGMKEDRIFLMPMMVDNSKFFQEEKVFPDIFTFLYVGRLVQSKNVEGLINQFNNKFSNIKAILKIIGTGEEEEFLKNKYASKRVLFLGAMFDDDLVFQFKNASCFVFPSKVDAWGLVINEALSSALPVIATKEVGACYDLIKGKGTGMVASNIYEFGDMMLELYNDSSLLVDFSNNACDIMKNRWNYDLYNECLKEAIHKVKQWA